MKKVLLVIDYQNDFVDGSLGFPDAKELDKKIAALIDFYHQNNDDVIFTFDTHDDNYLNTKEGKNLPTPHCIFGTSGHSLYGLTSKAINKKDKIFNKPSFGSLELGNYLKEKGYDDVLIVGLVTNICVLSNAIIAKAALPEARITVDSKLVDSFDKEAHISTLKLFKGVGIDVQ
ncbi:cysteine hydrolase [Acholeplasma sp. OttesenSCG-928-E16]|nr:cysteine hydrolase [Acholeplasma sp. OttesenSCG-928-E16]